MNRLAYVLILCGVGAGVFAVLGGEAPGADPTTAAGTGLPEAAGTSSGDSAPKRIVETPESCAGCHRTRQPGLLAQWDASAHAREGVTCESCHGSDHEKIFGAKGHVPASRCAKCHEKQTSEFLQSAHARSRSKALANGRLLAQIPAVQRRGCLQCHALGAEEEAECNACHGAHRHSVADARRPSACGVCHMGPDHPHIEAFEASPHGVAYAATHDERQAPTCATCHMPKGSHDVSQGLTLGMSGSGAVLEGEHAPIPMHTITKENARIQRRVMLARCTKCHAERTAREALADADSIKREADRLVGEAVLIVEALHAEDLLDPAPEDRLAHPTKGHTLVLGGEMLYENQSEAERIFFDLAKFAHAITFKSAYHQAADHTHWLGIARLKAGLVELRAEARRLRR